jgi:DNA-binding MarR family transcriptional regulator
VVRVSRMVVRVFLIFLRNGRNFLRIFFCFAVFFYGYLFYGFLINFLLFFMDITRDEIQNDAKKNVLEKVANILQDSGLNPEDYNLSIFKKPKVKSSPNIQLFQTAAYLAATTLSPSANKILMYFLSLSEFENYVGIDQKTINEELCISLSATEKGLKELRDNGVIVKVDHLSDKRRNDYFINPMHAWKGKMLNRKIALSKLHKNQNQLHLFGETLEESQIREEKEIKAKKPLYPVNKQLTYEEKRLILIELEEFNNSSISIECEIDEEEDSEEEEENEEENEEKKHFFNS